MCSLLLSLLPAVLSIDATKTGLQVEDSQHGSLSGMREDPADPAASSAPTAEELCQNDDATAVSTSAAMGVTITGCADYNMLNLTALGMGVITDPCNHAAFGPQVRQVCPLMCGLCPLCQNDHATAVAMSAAMGVSLTGCQDYHGLDLGAGPITDPCNHAQFGAQVQQVCPLMCNLCPSCQNDDATAVATSAAMGVTISGCADYNGLDLTAAGMGVITDPCNHDAFGPQVKQVCPLMCGLCGTEAPAVVMDSSAGVNHMDITASNRSGCVQAKAAGLSPLLYGVSCKPYVEGNCADDNEHAVAASAAMGVTISGCADYNGLDLTALGMGVIDDPCHHPQFGATVRQVCAKMCGQCHCADDDATAAAASGVTGVTISGCQGYHGLDLSHVEHQGMSFGVLTDPCHHWSLGPRVRAVCPHMCNSCAEAANVDRRAVCGTLYEQKYRGNHRRGFGEQGQVLGGPASGDRLDGSNSEYSEGFDLVGETHLCEWSDILQSCEAGHSVSICPEDGHVVQTHASGVGRGLADPTRT